MKQRYVSVCEVHPGDLITFYAEPRRMLCLATFYEGELKDVSTKLLMIVDDVIYCSELHNYSSVWLLHRMNDA